MPVITIRGQLGSGAPEIGRLLATHLGIDYVDREIIAGVAARLNYPETRIAKQEMPPATLGKRIQDALERSYPPVPDTSTLHPVMMYLPPSEMPLDDSGYLAGLTSVIKALAASNNIVIRGRGSQFILKDHPGARHVLTVAPPEVRVKRVMETLKISEKAAARRIKDFDSSRRAFIKRYFKAGLEDPMHYDAVINTGHFTYPAAAAMVISLLAPEKPAPEAAG